MAKRLFIGVAAIVILGLASVELLAKATYDGNNTITIADKGNTLGSIARDIGDDKIFGFDKKEQVAVANSILHIPKGAELSIGDMEGLKQTLRLNYVPEKCQGVIIVDEGGTLNIYNSEVFWISHVKQEFYKLYGTRGNLWLLYSSGNLNMEGAIVEGYVRLEGNSSQARIKNSTILCAATWTVGFHICRIRHPLEINNLTIDGKNMPGTAGIIVGVSEKQFLRNLDFKGILGQQVKITLTDSPVTLLNPINFDLNKKVGFAGTKKNACLLVKYLIKLRIVDEQGIAMKEAKVKLEVPDSYVGSDVAVDKNGECWLKMLAHRIDNPGRSREEEGKLPNRVQTYQYQITIDDGTGYKVVKTNFTATKMCAFQYVRKADRSGYIETEIEYTEPREEVEQVVRQENFFYNSSFESATNPGIPDGCFMGMTRGLFPIHFTGIGWGVDETCSYHGKRSVKICQPEHDLPIYWVPCDAELPEPGFYTFSLYLKSDIQGFPLTFGSGFYGTKYPKKKKEVMLTPFWRRYFLTREIPPGSSQYQAWIKLPNDREGTIWLDAIQVEKGKIPTPYHYHTDMIVTESKEAVAIPEKMILPNLNAVKIDEAPFIDGRLNEHCWATAAKINKFFINKSGQLPTEKTKAYILYDNSNLYLGVECSESQMDKLKDRLKRQQKKRDGPYGCDDDCIEIFIDVNHDRKTYYQFRVNTFGTQYDGIGLDRSWDSNWKAKTSLGLNSWFVEASIPLKDIKILPGKQVWGLNINRAYPSKKEYISWSPTYNGFHCPERFGALGLNIVMKKGNFLIEEVSYCNLLLDKSIRIKARVKNIARGTKKLQLHGLVSSASQKNTFSSKIVAIRPGDSRNLIAKVRGIKEGKKNLTFSLISPKNKKLHYKSPSLFLEFPSLLLISSLSDFYSVENACKISINSPLSSDDTRKASIVLYLSKDKKPIITKKLNAFSAVEEGVSFDISNLPIGDYIVKGELLDKTGKILSKCSTIFSKLKRTNGIETKFGENGAFLVDGKETFPIGVCWGLSNPYKFPLKINDIAEHNFNVVGLNYLLWGDNRYCTSDEMIEARANKLKQYLDIVHSYKMGAFVNLTRSCDTKSKGDVNKEIIKKIVTAVKNHPALWGWYTQDTIKDKYTKLNCNLYNAIKEFDPYRIIWSVIDGSPKFLATPSYLRLSDVVITDPYPIPRRRLTLVSKFTDEAIELASGKKPVWIVPQLFGGTQCFFREPTPEEERCMVYLAITHGAKGILYFEYRPDYDRLWEEVGKLNREIMELAPILLSSEVSQDFSVSPAYIHCLQKNYQDKIYLITVNSSYRPIEAEFILPELNDKSEVNVLFANKKIQPIGGKFSDYFKGFASHVYEVTF